MAPPKNAKSAIAKKIEDKRCSAVDIATCENMVEMLAENMHQLCAEWEKAHNCTLIRASREVWTIFNIIKMILDGIINLMPPYQRDFVFEKGPSTFIYTMVNTLMSSQELLINDERVNNVGYIACCDGKQRLGRALQAYVGQQLVKVRANAGIGYLTSPFDEEYGWYTIMSDPKTKPLVKETLLRLAVYNPITFPMPTEEGEELKTYTKFLDAATDPEDLKLRRFIRPSASMEKLTRHYDAHLEWRAAATSPEDRMIRCLIEPEIIVNERDEDGLLLYIIGKEFRTEFTHNTFGVQKLQNWPPKAAACYAVLQTINHVVPTTGEISILLPNHLSVSVLEYETQLMRGLYGIGVTIDNAQKDLFLHVTRGFACMLSEIKTVNKSSTTGRGVGDFMKSIGYFIEHDLSPEFRREILVPVCTTRLEAFQAFYTELDPAQKVKLWKPDMVAALIYMLGIGEAFEDGTEMFTHSKILAVLRRMEKPSLPGMKFKEWMNKKYRLQSVVCLQKSLHDLTDCVVQSRHEVEVPIRKSKRKAKVVEPAAEEPQPAVPAKRKAPARETPAKKRRVNEPGPSAPPPEEESSDSDSSDSDSSDDSD
jgi:hypothetical protein